MSASAPRKITRTRYPVKSRVLITSIGQGRCWLIKPKTLSSSGFLFFLLSENFTTKSVLQWSGRSRDEVYLPMMGNCRALVVSANGVDTASSSALDIIEDRTELSVDEETGWDFDLRVVGHNSCPELIPPTGYNPLHSSLSIQPQ